MLVGLLGLMGLLLSVGVEAQTPKETLLRASNADPDDQFGRSVAIDGNWAIIGAYLEAGPSNNKTGAGAAYIFERSGDSWQEVQVLRASNAEASDNFGYSVAIDGDRVIVGASDEDGNTGDQYDRRGAAYVFERSSGTWGNPSGNGFSEETQILRASNADSDDNFGHSVAIDGDRAIVGAVREDGPSNGKSSAGAAYVFEWTAASGWKEVEVLRASNADPDDQFGRSVAIDGDRAIVTADEDGPSNGKSGAGAAYVFERSDEMWGEPSGTGFSEETQILRASDAEFDDQFGQSVAIDGDRAIVGARHEDGPSNNKDDAGAAYVFERTSSGWDQNEDKILRASNAEGGTYNESDNFGHSVSIDGERAIVGAEHEDGPSNSKTRSGAAYIKTSVMPRFTAGAGTSLTVKENGSADLTRTLEVADLSSSDNLTWHVTSAPSGLLSGVDGESKSVSGSDSPHTLSTSPTYTPGADVDGSDRFNVQVADGSATDEITVDVIVQDAPEVTSITPTGSAPTNAGSVDFEVTFSESVSGVGTGDFTAVQASGSASGTVSSVSGSGTTYTVTVVSITGTGDLRLDLEDDDSITNGNDVPLGGVGTSGAGDGSTGGAVTVDKTVPTAEAGSDMTVDSGTEIAFDGSGSSDNDGIASYTWDFGDGTTATGKTPTHTYSNSGTYTATLTVTDEAGNTDSDAATITVNNAPSISALSDRTVRAGQTPGPVSLTVSDPETAAEQLALSASSGNTTLVPESGLTVTGPDGSGTASLEVEPVSGETGTATVTVTAEDKEGQTTSSSFVLQVAPSAVSANVVRSFGDASGPGDYRLVALPGQVDQPLGQVVGGDAGQEWQAYRDDGSGSGFLVEYDGPDDFTFRPGTGFWLTSTETWTSSHEASVVDLQDGTAEIDLRDGWNVISNPLGKDVSWSAVEKQNVDTQNGESLQPLWGFDGSFGKASTFASATGGTAYYFLNDRGLNALQIPYPSSSGSKANPRASAGAKETSSEETAGRTLTLTARRAEVPDSAGTPGSTVRVGLHPDANRSVGPRDVAAPPARFSAVALRVKARSESVSQKARSKRMRTLMAERRPASEMGEGYTFSLRLRRQGEGPVTMDVGGAEAFSGRSVALVNRSSGTSHDLQKTGTVEVPASAFGPDGQTALTVAVGTEDYVTQQKRAARPSEVTLTAYPNPVRQQGTLKYTLPEAGEVSLQVYDVLGRQVQVLASGRKEVGRHTATLPASRLSSGVYIARLRVGGRTVTQKITVVR